jgi:hypothetical protein
MIDVSAAVEELSATSHQEATKVLEEWQSDYEDTSSSSDDDLPEDLVSIMEVDEQIGANLLDDEVFGGCCGNDNGSLVAAVDDVEDNHYCSSPTGPLEELVSFSTMSHHMATEEDEDAERFLAPLLENDEDDTGCLLIEPDMMGFDAAATAAPMFVGQAPLLFADERYQQVLKKLAESMKKSQETRKSLTMKTPNTEKYGRTKSVTGVLSSIESSSRQIQTYLQVMQRAV